MAKKIEWTYSSIRDRYLIYQYWVDNNKSDTYSEKLERLFKEAAKLISVYPGLGSETDMKGIRVKVVENFKLFYRVHQDSIQVLRLWDTRQNPDSLKVE